MKTVFLAAALLAATPALAQSNIGLSDYPAPKCDKPAPLDPALKPIPLPPDPGSGQIEIYNAKVAKFNAAARERNAQMVAFGACMKDYVANADADIQRIHATVDAAVAAANSN